MSSLYENIQHWRKSFLIDFAQNKAVKPLIHKVLLIVEEL